MDLINLSPSVPLKGDVPQRVWSGKDVSYNYLKVFGCRAFVHIPKDERSKLDDRSKQCIFLGYGHEEFGYRLWDPATKKVIRSRDVVFFEHQTIEDIDKPEKPKNVTQQRVNFSPNPPTVLGENQGGEAHGNHEDDESSQNVDSSVESGESVEQERPVEPVEQEEPVLPQVRRSERERRPSQRY